MLRPRGNVGSPHPDHQNLQQPDTPAAHYADGFGTQDERTAHVHAQARAESASASHGSGSGSDSPPPRPDTPPRRLSGGWRRKGGKFGLSQRAWLALAVVVGFILLTKLLVPSEPKYSSSTSHHHLAHDPSELTPHNYLNASATDSAPFEFCPVFGPGDAVASRRGQFELLRSRLYTGTGARVQRVLRKAMGGMPVTISVLGGSVSACQGAGDDPIAPECYPARFFQWWNSIFPHPNNELTNGANKRTDSAYYAYCASHHLPDKTDLVILEFDAADPNDPDWLSYFELLVRSILVRPDQPAVIILGHFSPQVQAQNGFAGPELLHNAVAQFYDVPHISAKGVMYDEYLARPRRALSGLYADSQLANKEGHDLLADVLISFIMSQICAGWSALLGQSFNVPSLNLKGESVAGTPLLLGGVGLRPGTIEGQQPDDGATDKSDLISHSSSIGLEVPKMRLRDRPNELKNFREIEPFCVAASDLVTPLPPSIFYGSGWATYHPPSDAVVEDKHYWYADQPTSRLRVPLRIGAGDVGIYFVQQPVGKPAGTVQCWVDDNREGAKTLVGTAEVEEAIATLVLIDRGVSRGSHFVECQLAGERGAPTAPFKILGIFTT